MTTDSAGAPKYGRGEHPRSLSNLKAPWTSETRPDPAPRGPLVTPALKRFAAMPMHELRALLDQAQDGDVPFGLTVAEAIALTMIKDAFTTGAFTTGSKSREQVLERVDGPVAKGQQVEVDVGVLVRYVSGG